MSGLKSTTALAALTVTLLTATTASAEPPAEPQRIAPGFAWSGFYIGSHFGYAGGKATTTLFDSSTQTATGRFGTLVGGVQAGYARLLGPRLLLGLEADVSVPNFLENNDRVSSVSSAVGQVDEKIDCFGALRARLGYAFSYGLLYGTGGLGWSLGHFIHNTGADQVQAEQRRIRPGWMLGAGYELDA